jgi:3-methyladenine DNA glycosylase AlkD
MNNDYISFLDKRMLANYESTIIYGIIINNLKDVKLIKKYLDIYVNYVDNWSSCDVLSIKTNNKEELFNIGVSYTKSDLAFVRRVGYRILFAYVDNVEYLCKIFNIIDECNGDETEYYVNMMVAWLLCEAFIKNRELTIKYLDSNRLNEFTVNKFVSKCRDSFRVSKLDKDMLIKYKK